jgi:hypothetical protein
MERSGGLRRAALGTVAALLLATPSAWADNVKVKLKGSKLTVTGDAGDNELTLTTTIALDAAGPPTSVQLTPAGDTTVNGAAAPLVVDGVVDVNVSLGGGDDAVSFSDFVIAGSLTVLGGAGDDDVTLLNATTGLGTTIAGGAGKLTAHATTSSVHGNLVIKAAPSGFHQDTVALSGVTVDGDTSLSLGAGFATLTDANASTLSGGFKVISGGSVKFGGGFALTFTDTTIGQDVQFKLGSGAHGAILQHASIGGPLVWKSGAGADSLIVRGTSLGADCHATMGAGANIASFDVFDFVPGPGSATTQIVGALEVSATGGADLAKVLAGTSIGGECSLVLGDGANTAIVTGSSVGADLVIKTGKGDDHATVNGDTVAGQTTIDLGPGTNIGP